MCNWFYLFPWFLFNFSSVCFLVVGILHSNSLKTKEELRALKSKLKSLREGKGKRKLVSDSEDSSDDEKKLRPHSAGTWSLRAIVGLEKSASLHMVQVSSKRVATND